ncbi:hypothetical protein HD597_000647 [Nonomuraea thailandensis]|uniref:Uncharacterized protein n=1 Tax=Nonomuraea thailandensis TaxID=1188745 RepID=A0A9X2G6W7_9ACTN|nr:hypothetical protein [Nonomuraea thailandensis]
MTFLAALRVNAHNAALMFPAAPSLRHAGEGMVSGWQMA